MDSSVCSETRKGRGEMKNRRPETGVYDDTLGIMAVPGGASVFDAFNAQAKNMGDLLSDNQPVRIIVPRFQRGYAGRSKGARDGCAQKLPSSRTR